MADKIYDKIFVTVASGCTIILKIARLICSTDGCSTDGVLFDLGKEKGVRKSFAWILFVLSKISLIVLLIIILINFQIFFTIFINSNFKKIKKHTHITPICIKSLSNLTHTSRFFLKSLTNSWYMLNDWSILVFSSKMVSVLHQVNRFWLVLIIVFESLSNWDSC